MASAIKARAGGAPSPETQELIQKLQRQVSSLAEEKEQYEMQLEGMKSVVRDQQREMQELKEAAPDGGAAFTEANELRIKMENVEQAHAVDMAELTKRLEASELVAAESRAAASVASTASAAKSGADSQALQQQLSDASDQLAVLKASSKGAADEAAAHIAKLETERVRERSNKSVADQLLVEKSAALEAAIVGSAKHEETIAALRKEKADLLVEKHATGEAQAELQTAAGEEKAALQAALDARAAELTELRASGAESAAQLSASEERNAAAAAAADAAAAAAAVAAAEASAQRDEIAALHARVESLEDDIEDCAVKVKIQAKQRNKLIKELKADLGKQHKRLTSTEAQLQEAADMKGKQIDEKQKGFQKAPGFMQRTLRYSNMAEELEGDSGRGVIAARRLGSKKQKLFTARTWKENGNVLVRQENYEGAGFEYEKAVAIFFYYVDDGEYRPLRKD